jgi:hypothetical protein
VSDYEEKIARGLALYLKEVCNVKGEITNARLSSFDPGGEGGCDTCDYGSTEAGFDIDYNVDGLYNWVRVDEEVLQFFSIILPYIDRAN